MPGAQDTPLAEIEALSTSIWSDLSEHSGGIFWWADYEMEAADLLDLSDYLYGVAEGIGTNLKLAETYLSEYRNKRATLDFQLRGYARTHVEGRLELGTFGFGKNSWDVEHHIAFDREPSLTTTQSFRNARVQHVESIYLLEDQQATMEGVLGSLQAAVIGTIVPCRSLWDLRRTNPELIHQPARQWVNPTEGIDFPGYQPNPDFYKHQNAMVVNPKDATRLGASRILENARSSNPPTRR